MWLIITGWTFTKRESLQCLYVGSSTVSRNIVFSSYRFPLSWARRAYLVVDARIEYLEDFVNLEYAIQEYRKTYFRGSASFSFVGVDN